MRMLVCLLLACLATVRAVPWEVVTELDDYVNAPESVYGYSVLYTDDTVPGVTVHFLNLTSLQWKDETLTTTPVWWHYLTIAVPDTVSYSSAIMWIANGYMDDPVPTVTTDQVVDIINLSQRTGAVTSLLNMVPNQPLNFTNEEDGMRPRIEDAIIGYSWKLFIEETVTDTDVILLFPMVKAAKLAVDALFEYVPTAVEGLLLDGIVPTGFSKRGWTSWLLGCVDQRVVAMAPVVFDLLNFYENIQHHYTSLGGWTWAFAPYWNTDVPRYLHHPRTQLIGSHIDPLEYNERLTMPKILHGAAGDEFFLPDGTWYWWDQINGPENHYVLFENEVHSISDHRPQYWENVATFFTSVMDSAPFPEYSVQKSTDSTAGTGTISVTIVTPPTSVRVWAADTTNRTCEPDDDITGTCRRDFRVDRYESPTETGILWTDTELFDQGGGVYSVTYDEPAFGFKIFHIEMTFPGPDSGQWQLTTESQIIPDILPYPICVTEEECQGVIK